MMPSEPKITKPLRDLASIIRSKNAGPFRLTFDILFDNEENFLCVVASNAINPKTVAQLFGVAQSQVSSLYVLPEGLAIKITLLRPKAQCASGESDVYGCQQHVPLMSLPIPLAGNYKPADTAH